MLSFAPRLATTALALVFAAQAAQADLSAADVWEDWRSYVTGLGNTVTGDEAMSGDTLTVSNLQFEMVMPNDGDTSVLEIGTLSLRENDDGTVDIAIPDVMTVAATMAAKADEQVSYKLDIAQAGFRMTAAGDKDDLTYSYSADQLRLLLRDVIVNGKAVPSDLGAFAASLNDIVGTTAMQVADLRLYDQTMTAGSITFDLTMTPPEDEGTVTMSGSASDLSFAGKGNVPVDAMESATPSELFAAGFGFDGTFNYGSGNSTVNVTTPDGPVKANSTSTGGAVAIEMSGESITYNVSQQGLAVEMLVAAMPIPIEFAMQESLFNFTMPLAESEDARDFAFGFTLGEFTMSDILWGMFDPKGQLPRDPATIALDLTGKARLLFDFLDPEAAETASNDPGFTPAEIEALDINTVQVTVAGAELTGNGAFTFENTPEGGMPKPTGAVDLKLVGGNGLLNKLVAMGLLPEEQAMGARMMMGLFAVPGEADDTLTSKIEINEEGNIIANGQPIE